MGIHKWVLTSDLEFDFLTSKSECKTIFSPYMSFGAFGCALSHLSIFQDAYDTGYETIWVMEDDILVNENPHEMTALIQELDGLTDSNWDILYTDSDYQVDLWCMWRPDFPLLDASDFGNRTKISKNFTKIAARTRTHSMVIRRSGVEKILNHLKSHGLFLPYDHEIAFATGMQMYMTERPFVTWLDSPSDIEH